MGDSPEKSFYLTTDMEKNLNILKQIANDSNYNGCKESDIQEILQNCIYMLNTWNTKLSCMETESCTSNITTDIIMYEKAVIASFKHCSQSNLIYGDLIINFQDLLIEIFKKTSELQMLFFKILDQIEFDFTKDGDLDLLINALKYTWYSAEAVYKANRKIMTTNCKVYIILSQKYVTALKENIINDEPIEFLCAEIKQLVLAFQNNDEASLKLCSYMMNFLVKLCSYGRMLKSHNTLVEFILFLNGYWMYNTLEVVILKKRLLQFIDQLVLISDITFVKIFQSNCQNIIINKCSRQQISALYISTLLLKRLFGTPCHQLLCDIISDVFQLMKSADWAICSYRIDIYEPLLINLAAIILMSDYKLFEYVEKILIKNILNTEYWSAMLSIDLWIILMRYLSSDMCNMQFSKLAKLYEALAVFPCFTQCPQHIYFETLLKRHFNLITDKKQLINTCPQFKSEHLKSTVGILNIPTLSKYNCSSELVKIMTLLPNQKNYEHLNGDISNLWDRVQEDKFPSNLLCALVEISINSEALIKKIIPKTTKMLSFRANHDTIDMKRCRLRLIRSILLHMPTFQENLMMEIFLEYLFDHHPMVRQWTVEAIVYICSVIRNPSNLICMLFKRPEVKNVVKNYLEMNITQNYTQHDLIQYFETISMCGQFQHTCLFNGNLDKILDKLKTHINCLNNIVSKTQISQDDLIRLKECSSLLNNIYETKQINISFK